MRHFPFFIARWARAMFRHLGDDQPDREIRHRLGVAALDVEHEDAAPGRLGEIDVLDARAGDAGDARLRHGVEDLAREGNEKPHDHLGIGALGFHQVRDRLDLRALLLDLEPARLETVPVGFPVPYLEVPDDVSQVFLRCRPELASRDHRIPKNQRFQLSPHPILRNIRSLSVPDFTGFLIVVK